MNTNPIIVCVRDASHAEMLLHSAAQLLEAASGPLMLLSVYPTDGDPEEVAHMVQQLYNTARAAGAELNLLFDDHPVIAAAGAIRRSQAAYVVTGQPTDTSRGFISGLRRLVPGVPVAMVTGPEMFYMAYPMCAAARPSPSVG